MSIFVKVKGYKCQRRGRSSKEYATYLKGIGTKQFILCKPTNQRQKKIDNTAIPEV